MKKLTLSLFAVLLFLGLKAEDQNIVIESEIKEATVFMRGAQITREAKKFLTPGTYFLVFDGLTMNVNPSSVQVEGKGDFTILSVSHQRNYLKGMKENEKIALLEDTLESLNEDLNYELGMRSVYKEERNMIVTNRKIEPGEELGFAIEDLEEMSEFFRNRLRDIMMKQKEINRKEKELREEIRRINGQLSQLRTGNKQSSEIVVEVAVKKNTPASFKLKYYVPNAGWNPVYDLRASGPDKKIQLDYNAQVYQSTGIDWKKVKLELSTSNPTQRTNKPEVNPWVLRFIGNVQKGMTYQSNRNAPLALQEIAVVADDAGSAQTVASQTTVAESQLNINFKIDIAYNIPSDNKRHTVNVRQEELEADYYYFAAPKYSDKTFLVASVGGWEKYQLLSGQASIYYQGVYLGKTYINANNTNAKLDISFGEDKQVVVKRKRIEDYCESKMIGNNKKENIGLELSVKNTKSTKIKLVLKDQIPISSNKEITVELEESGGAQHDEQTGTLSWEYELAPSESKKHEFKYIVKYPKDKSINL